MKFLPNHLLEKADLGLLYRLMRRELDSQNLPETSIYDTVTSKCSIKRKINEE